MRNDRFDQAARGRRHTALILTIVVHALVFTTMVAMTSNALDDYLPVSLKRLMGKEIPVQPTATPAQAAIP